MVLRDREQGTESATSYLPRSLHPSSNNVLYTTIFFYFLLLFVCHENYISFPPEEIVNAEPFPPHLYSGVNLTLASTPLAVDMVDPWETQQERGGYWAL